MSRFVRSYVGEFRSLTLPIGQPPMQQERCARLREAEMADDLAELSRSCDRVRVHRIEPCGRFFRFGAQLSLVDREHATVLEHHASVNHHAVDGGPVFGEDYL